MIEVFIIIAVLFFIAVMFYKQGNEEFQILQLEGDRLEEPELPALYGEHNPIVVRGFQTPAIGTEETLRKRPQILQMSVGTGVSLRDLLTSPQRLATFLFTPTTAEFLAKESGLQIWFEHHLYRKLLPSRYTAFAYSFRTQLWPHHRGLTKTTAFQTLVMPTQGTVTLSLLLPKSLPYLPTGWKGRPFSSLTLADTPLLAQIQFLEIKLRKGSFALLPAHVLYDVSTSGKEVAWTCIAEIHHPISRLASGS